MRPGLLAAGWDLDPEALPPGPPDLVGDLALEHLYAAMAGGDPHLLEIARRVVPAGLRETEAVRYRQAVLADCLADPETVRELYRLAAAAVEAERRAWGSGLRSTELVLRRAAGVLEAFLASLRDVRVVTGRLAAGASSEGVAAFAASVAENLDDAFLEEAAGHVRNLAGRTLIVSARLGEGNRGVGHVLHQPPVGTRRLRERIGLDEARGLTVEVALHDQNAMNAVGELRSLALAGAAGAVDEAVAHVLSFFRTLRDELGFYVGCLNLRGALERLGVATCMPVPEATSPPALSTRGLVDPCLALATQAPVVGNDVEAGVRSLVVVTGANGGGKSTLLRAVGVAQVMLGAGMFVAAEACQASLRPSVLTHFSRREETLADGGRLDAELEQLSALVDAAHPGSLVLLNEPLSSTNERDGALIAEGLVTGLIDGGATVWLVTHLFELAVRLGGDERAGVLFLRAERGADGERPFRLVEAAPLATSFGGDLYRRILGAAGEAAP